MCVCVCVCACVPPKGILEEGLEEQYHVGSFQVGCLHIWLIYCLYN